MTEKKIQVGIYQIEDIALEEISQKITSKGYALQELDENEQLNYKLFLYYKKNPPTDPKWKDFLAPIVKADQNILLRGKSNSESFILLVSNDDSTNIFAIAGGTGYFIIQEDINVNFGIDILSRIISKEEKILKSIREKSVVGGILGTTKFFRSNFNLIETDNFGKIFQELKANLDKDILIGKLGLDEEIIKKDSVCIAKSSFKVNKSISFDQLLTVIKGCESILENEEPIVVNNVEKLAKNKNIDLITNLENQLLNQLWDRFNKTDDSFLFDLCHRNLEQYITAAHYVVKKNTSKKPFFPEHDFEELLDIDDLFDQLHGHRSCPENINDLKKLVNTLYIYSYDEEGNLLTKDTLIAHVLGDVSFNDKKYFFIDKAWYHIKEEFMSILNDFCQSFISTNYIENLDITWNYPEEVENDYNYKYLNNENTIVLDKITPENIEACDILKWDDDKLYLIHVKAGFGNTMRDLCSQIAISASRVSQDLITSKEYINKIYSSLENKIGGEAYFDAIGKQTETYNRETFLQLFEKEIVFVLAVLDTAKNKERHIKGIEDFGSNIAKFSLQELAKEMRGAGINLKITQIFRE